MNIQFDITEKVNGKMTVTIENGDISAEVDKILKDYRKRANIPGFRPGMAPMGMIKRQVGPQAKMDAVNQVLGKSVNNYMEENKIQMLGRPMADLTQEAVDIEGDGPYVFKFDIAIKPELAVKIDGSTTLPYYEIEADKKTLDEQVEMYARRNGQYVKAENYDPAKNDLLKGDLRQLDAEGNTLEGGITVADSSMMPEYIKVEEQKALFNGCKPGDIITFNPRKAYPDNDAEVAAMLKITKEEVANVDSDFSYQITEIQRYEPAEVNQELFDKVFTPAGTVTSEEDFRARIAEQLRPQLTINSDYKFLEDLRAECMSQVADVKFPEDLLKRVLREANTDKDEEYIEKNFAGSLEQLKWQLVREDLAVANEVKVEDADLKEVARARARMQFAQYGMNDVPDEYINNFADDMLKKRENVDEFIDRALDRKLMEKIKTVVKIDVKKLTLDEFRKMMGE